MAIDTARKSGKKTANMDVKDTGAHVGRPRGVGAGVRGRMGVSKGGRVLDQLTSILAGSRSATADARWEENRRVEIVYKGPVLTECRMFSTQGGHVRAFDGGGKALVSVSETEDLIAALGRACAAARAVGRGRREAITLADVPPVVGDYSIHPRTDPRAVPLKRKLELLAHYNALVLAIPGIATTHATYTEWTSERAFAATNGTAVTYEIVIANVAVRAVARQHGVVQETAIAFGGSSDFSRMEDRDRELAERARTAVALLEAPQIEAGRFPVILDPDEASLFVHEAFGHLSEGDGIQDNPSFRERLKLGTEIAVPMFSVTDDATLPDLPGSYEVDDEGVLAQRTELIRNGVLAGRLHSRETAADFGEPTSGNMRAVDAFHTPIVRMSNVFVEPGTDNLADMFAAAGDGYYLIGAKGGQTSGDQFTFGAQYGWRIKNGKQDHLVRDVNMSGELFSTLQRIAMVGDDLKFSERGGCGKGGVGPMQLNAKSGKGAPHVLISEVTVGGVR